MACALIVLGLHLIVLDVLAHNINAPQKPTRAQLSALMVRWVQPQPSALKLAEVALPAAQALEARGTFRKPLSSSDISLSGDDKPARQLVQNDAAAAGVDQGWNPLRYHTSQDVDTRAVPTIDWVIHRESVPRNSLAVLVITVWVSATGVVDHFQIEDQQPAGSWVSSALSSLQTTTMEPATLGGEPVASTMTIEISLDNNTDEPGNN